MCMGSMFSLNSPISWWNSWSLLVYLLESPTISEQCITTAQQSNEPKCPKCEARIENVIRFRQ